MHSELSGIYPFQHLRNKFLTEYVTQPDYTFCYLTDLMCLSLQKIHRNILGFYYMNDRIGYESSKDLETWELRKWHTELCFIGTLKHL